jgi:hypothetical protein
MPMQYAGSVGEIRIYRKIAMVSCFVAAELRAVAEKWTTYLCGQHEFYAPLDKLMLERGNYTAQQLSTFSREN